MIEFRYWLQQQARAHYDALTAKGIAANMSADGKGVIVRWRLS
jgi:hypothetical protein